MPVKNTRIRKGSPLLKLVGRVALVVAGGWFYVMVLNRSLDGDLEALDDFVRDNLKKRGLI